MEEKVKAVDDIQAEIREAARRIDAVFRDLDVPQLLKKIESHIPNDTEAMGNDEEQPSVAWEIQGDLGSLLDPFAELSALLEKAGSYTPESVRREWIGRLLDEVQDPPVRVLLALVLKADQPLQAVPRPS